MTGYLGRRAESRTYHLNAAADPAIKPVQPQGRAMAGVLARLAPPPRLVDWSIFALVTFEVVSGLVSLTVGRPAGAWLFVLHAVAGFTLVALLVFKFRRVRHRVQNTALWDGGTPISIALGVVALAALATGAYWAVSGLTWVAAWPLLTLHMALGLLVVPLVVWHLRHRFRPPRRRDVTSQSRRTALQYTALLGVGALSWRLQEAAGSALDLPGGERRFTGSKVEGSDAGNDFPITSWVADDPDPVDPAEWTLSVTGAVENSLELGYEDLGATADRRATLDCTSGWYSVQDWGGVRVGDLLETAGAGDDARWISFRSVTGYRWSLPVEEAREALLATRVGDEPLSHGHGFPARLVAPGRRGFQWVKWVEHVEVRTTPDYGQWIAIFVSGFD